jgi:hypothetical protein
MQSTIVSQDRKSGAAVGAITYPGYLGGLAVGGAGGVVYACDPNAHRVFKYSSGAWSVFAGSTQGYAEKTTKAGRSAKFSSPGACCIQGTALYVADAGGTLLRAVTLSSGITKLVVGRPGLAGAARDGGGAVGQLLGVTSVCADIYPSRLLVTDGHAIRRIDVVAAAGQSTVTTLAGQASTPGYWDAPGPAWTAAPVNTAARFDQPRGIVALNEGYASADTPALNWVVYVADTNNHCIRRVDTFLNVTTLAGSPKTPGANDGSTGGIDDVRFTFPAAMGVDKYGRYAFVADNAVATAADTAADTPRLRRLAVNVCKGTCTFDAATNSSVFDGSAAYCGGCPGNDGEACAAPMECRTGACACPKGFVMCGGRCVDTLRDAANCSKCGKKCLGEQVCVNGKCTDPVCKSGLACNHRCVNPQTDAGNCGKCGLACRAGQSCVCGACSSARDMSSDPNNCGACGVKCPPGKICSNGRCVCDVFSGFRDCEGTGTCSNITSDAAHCGLCNIHCRPGMVCQNRQCVLPAAPPPPVSRFRLFRA